MSAFGALFRRDIAVAWRQGGGGGVSLGFFVLATALTPLALGPEAESLAPVAAGIVWISAALAALLGLERLFQADAEEGGLELIANAPIGLIAGAAAKIAAFWTTVCLPAAVIAPLLGVLLQAPSGEPLALCVSLLIGSPAFALVGGVAAALTTGVRRGGMLISLLALPLFAPTLIFGASAVHQAPDEGLLSEPMLFLGAFSFFCLATCPFAAAAALRLNLE